MDHDYHVTSVIIGCAIEVHRTFGPGLTEKAYQIALSEALSRRQIKYAAQPWLKATYHGVAVGTYRPDLIVDETVIVEIKAVDRLTPVFTAQVLAYLKVAKLRVGLILNFKAATMREGIKRVVL